MGEVVLQLTHSFALCYWRFVLCGQSNRKTRDTAHLLISTPLALMLFGTDVGFMHAINKKEHTPLLIFNCKFDHIQIHGHIAYRVTSMQTKTRTSSAGINIFFLVCVGGGGSF